MKYSTLFAIFLMGVIFENTTYANPTFSWSKPKPSAHFSSILPADKKPKKEFAYRQVASVYPVKALSNCMMLGYERQVGAKHIFKIAAGYTNFAEQALNTAFNNELSQYSGMRFDMTLKYYIGKETVLFNGIYVAPFFSFKNAKFQYRGNDFFSPGIDVWEDGTAASYTIGGIMGVQFPITESFVFDFYVGNANMNSSGNYKEASRFMDSYRNSIGLISGFSLGFGF